MPPKKKKSAKAKAKKAAIQAETARMQARRALLTAAASPSNAHLAPLVAFQSFKRNDLDLKIGFKPVAELTDGELEAAFNLLKENMQQQ